MLMRVGGSRASGRSLGGAAVVGRLMSTDQTAAIKAAASAVRKADAILLTTGAGFGVDSGLPDFRGDEGFWKAYSPMKKLGLGFTDCANPEWFSLQPTFAW
eukprot:gene23549-12704_t